ncbi:SH3-domain-containing protein [Mycena indigotica]|uniref:SH3-domain-containing protein n=1 Tax=Mycena indigotica TaxID=2126181 RepID=A0A8H6S6I1_9AGAR|nr:SH3-domain-containing protein [Mycena indigotica]KAF7292210.1 SH3-domain-containing protein [Mycena indigotica]
MPVAVALPSPAPSPTPSPSPMPGRRHSNGGGDDRFIGDVSRDFCNAFWGAADAGVSVLFGRLRGAIRTTEELRLFWQQRATIEEEYAGKLTQLAQMRVGRDEIGDLRSALDTVLFETAQQGTHHLHLATQLRTAVGQPTTDLLTRQITHRKDRLTPLEQRFTDKQVKERELTQAKEKYADEALKVAQLQQKEQPRTLASGHQDADLRRAQLAVHVAEREVANLTAAMAEAGEWGPSWEDDWKEFCDASQDMEEERVEATREVLEEYAEAISGVCTVDAESSARIRATLDQLNAVLEVATFVQQCATGNTLPDLPIHIPLHNLRDGSVSPQPLPPRTADYTRTITRYQHPYPSPQSQQGRRKRPRSDTIVPAQPVVPLTPPPLPSPPLASQTDSLSAMLTGDGLHSRPTTPTPSFSPSTTTSTDASPPLTSSPPRGLQPILIRPLPHVALATPGPDASFPSTITAPASSIPVPPSPRPLPPPTPSLPRKTRSPLPPQTRRISGPLPLPPVRSASAPTTGLGTSPTPPIGGPVSAPLTPLPADDTDAETRSDGEPILFYVQAHTAYAAATPTELDLEPGDIVAVTATPADGWWAGALLDERRKEEGRRLFPSGCVELF